MPAFTLEPLNALDRLCDIFLLIMRDGGNLTGMSYGEFTLLICGLLMPLAIVTLMAAASLALNPKKICRRFAIAFLVLGVLCAVAAFALVTYAAVFGQTWAK